MSSEPSTTPEAPAEATGKAPRKAPRRATGKTRPAARPYKKLESAILKTRIADCTRKITLLDSRTVILRDRLGAYEREEALREQLQEESNE